MQVCLDWCYVGKSKPETIDVPIKSWAEKPVIFPVKTNPLGQVEIGKRGRELVIAGKNPESIPSIIIETCGSRGKQTLLSTNQWEFGTSMG